MQQSATSTRPLVTDRREVAPGRRSQASLVEVKGGSLRPLPRRLSGVPAPSVRPNSALAERMAEFALVERLLESDPAAWRKFTADYSPVILGCIRRVLSRFSRVTSDHDVEEVYARFSCELVSGDRKKLRSFDPEKGSRLSTWMGLLATNATYDYLRRVKRDRTLEPLPESDHFTSPAPSPYEQVSQKERAVLAEQVLGGLSERDREFVELYFGEGLDPELISAQMGISIKTVYTKKHKITARLEQLLERCQE